MEKIDKEFFDLYYLCIADILQLKKSFEKYNTKDRASLNEIYILVSQFNLIFL